MCGSAAPLSIDGVIGWPQCKRLPRDCQGTRSTARIRKERIVCKHMKFKFCNDLIYGTGRTIMSLFLFCTRAVREGTFGGLCNEVGLIWTR